MKNILAFLLAYLLACQTAYAYTPLSGNVTITGQTTNTLTVGVGAAQNPLTTQAAVLPGINLGGIPVPTQPTLSVTGTGVLTGNYNYFVTCVLPDGRSTVGYGPSGVISLPEVSPSSQQVVLTGIGLCQSARHHSPDMANSGQSIIPLV